MNQNTPLTAGRFFANLGKALLYLLLFLGAQVAVSMLYSAAASLYYMLQSGFTGMEDFPGMTQQVTDLVLACTGQISLISGLLTLLVLAVFFLLRRKNPFREVGLVAAPGRCVAAGGAMAPILYIAVSLIMTLLPEAWMEDYADASAALNDTGIVMAVATVLIAPIVEEVIFRGLVLSRLKRVMPGWLSVVLSALLFGVCHGQAVWMAYAFALGLLFGVMTLRTGSIWPSLIAHVVFNGIGQALTGLSEQAAPIFMGCMMLAAIILFFVFRRGFFELFFPRTKLDAV